MSESFYVRVLPRDLFNEAKLLKCLGYLALHIHDNKLQGLRLEFEGEPFRVDLTESGELYCSNIEFYLHNRPISFYTSYNDRSPFPLQFTFDEDLGRVFEDDGTYSEEFRGLGL